MPYIPNCDWEVVFSYATEDNNPLTQGQPGWVDKLADLLEKQLGAEGISGARVCARPAGNVREVDWLSAIERIAVIVTILSPAYLESPSIVGLPALTCARRFASRRPKSTFLVVKAEVSEQLVPDELWQLKPRRFYRIVEGVPLVLGLRNADNDDYLLCVFDLAYAISKELKRIRDHELPAPFVDPGESESDLKVFLAETTPELDESRAEIERFFEMHGIDVRPNCRLPTAIEHARDAITNGMRGCSAFVQLLGNNPEQIDPNGRTLLQLTIAESMLGEGLRVMHWRDPSFKLETVSNAQQRELLLRSTVHAESLSDFKSAVMEALETPELPILDELPVVFVDARTEDADELRRTFGRYRDVRWDWHETKALKELKCMCDIADAVLVYWGTGTSSMSQTRYYEFLKQWRARKKKERRVKIYDGPPLGKPVIQGAGLPVIYGRKGLPDELRQFIDDLTHDGR